MIQPRLPVIPSAARNLKSITTRPVSQCHVYAMTNGGKQRENSPGRLYLETDILDSSTPLRCAQNDSERVAFLSMESGAIVKYLPLSAPVGGEIQRGGGSGQTACFLSFETNFLRNFDTFGRTTTKQYGWNGFFSKYCWWYSSAS